VRTLIAVLASLTGGRANLQKVANDAVELANLSRENQLVLSSSCWILNHERASIKKRHC
jgi:hypothetical protein